MFKRSFVTAGLLMSFAAPVMASDILPQNQRLSADKVEADIALAKDAYRRVHAGYTRYADENTLDAAWTAIADKAIAQNGMTLGQFYLEVQNVLTLIRCDHTKAELPKALREDRNNRPVYMPLRWIWLEGRGFVTRANPETGLMEKDEILSIDGRPLAELVAEVRTLIPVDGYTEWAQESGISESSEFAGGAVDHFGALLWDIKENVTLTVKAATGEDRTVTLPRVTYDDWRALGDTSTPRNFKDAVSFEPLGETSGYLRIDTFVNYRDPVDPATLYDPIFERLKTEGRDSLILDLRKNGGGSDDASGTLLRNLITARYRPAKAACASTIDHSGLEEHLSTWDSRAINPSSLAFKKTPHGKYCLRGFFEDAVKKATPTKNAFTGKLIILTSRSNSSGSANIAARLQSQRDVVLVGEKTGGSAEGPTAGVIFFLTLPNSGVRTRIPFLRYYNNVDSFENGMGLTPDIFAPLTVEAFKADQDPALEAALALIKD